MTLENKDLNYFKDQVANKKCYIDKYMQKVNYFDWNTMASSEEMKEFLPSFLNEAYELWSASLLQEVERLKELVKNNAIEFAAFISGFGEQHIEDGPVEVLTLIDGNYYWANDEDGDQPLSEEQLYKWFEESKKIPNSQIHTDTP